MDPNLAVKWIEHELYRLREVHPVLYQEIFKQLEDNISIILYCRRDGSYRYRPTSLDTLSVEVGRAMGVYIAYQLTPACLQMVPRLHETKIILDRFKGKIAEWYETQNYNASKNSELYRYYYYFFINTMGICSREQYFRLEDKI